VPVRYPGLQITEQVRRMRRIPRPVQSHQFVGGTAEKLTEQTIARKVSAS